MGNWSGFTSASDTVLRFPPKRDKDSTHGEVRRKVHPLFRAPTMPRANLHASGPGWWRASCRCAQDRRAALVFGSHGQLVTGSRHLKLHKNPPRQRSPRVGSVVLQNIFLLECLGCPTCLTGRHPRFFYLSSFVCGQHPISPRSCVPEHAPCASLVDTSGLWIASFGNVGTRRVPFVSVARTRGLALADTRADRYIRLNSKIKSMLLKP